MKKNYTIAQLFFLLVALTAWTSLPAQPDDCLDPVILISDDIESYELGDATPQADHWSLWPSFDAGGIVTEEQAASGTKSIKIGDTDSQDVLLLLGDGTTTGHYIVQWNIYIPEGNNAYFNLQHSAPTASEGFWGFDVFMDDNGVGELDYYDGQVPFAYPLDTWFFVRLILDLDADQARVIIGDRIVAVFPFTSASGDPSNELNSINFFPIDESYVYYVDDVNQWEIPAATTGRYCYTAEEVDALGTHTVPAIECFGGGWDYRYPSAGGIAGQGSYWYKYTVESDGILSISSCGVEADTRGWIFAGDDCYSLRTLGVNDDQCLLANGEDNYASYREAIVSAGQTIYIMWDDVWDASGFDWVLDLRTDEPVTGAFCESAEEIEPGEQTLVEFIGNAAVTGPNIGSSSGSFPTNYAMTYWYQYTPPADGFISISACEGAASDTRVWIYSGECGALGDLTLEGSDDDGCGGTGVPSLLDSLPVTGGTTYYIEWDDVFGTASFLWTLEFDTQVAVDDVALEEGVTIFPNPVSDVVNVRFDLAEAASNLTVQVFNTLGQPVYQKYMGQIQSEQLPIDVSRMASGIYIVTISDNNAQVTKTILVE